MLRSLAAYGVCARALSMTVDSHLHCWSSKFPYAEGKAPPATLGDEVASAEALLKVMDAQDVAQALIVQPINYLYAQAATTNTEKPAPLPTTHPCHRER